MLHGLGDLRNKTLYEYFPINWLLLMDRIGLRF